MMRWIFAIAVLWSAVARGQALLPVEQTVEDVDPLAVSQRHVEPGIGQFSHRVSLYRPADPFQLDASGLSVQPATGLLMQQNYLFEQPGVRAWTGRGDYLSLVDANPKQPKFARNVQPVIEGAFIELIPPGTVFDLTLPVLSPPPVEEFEDRRLNYRVDTRLDTQIDRQIRDVREMPQPIVGYGSVIVIEMGVPAPPRQTRPDPHPDSELSGGDSEQHVVDEPNVSNARSDQSNDSAGK